MLLTKSISSKIKLVLIPLIAISALAIIVKNFSNTPIYAAGDVTGNIVSLGKPVKKSNYPNNIWDLQVFDGKIYIGHGDWLNNAGPIPVISLNPLTNTFTTEYTVDDESIWRYRVLNDKLYIPGTDARPGDTGSGGGWGYGEYYSLDADGWNMYRNTPGGVHVLDMAYYNGKLYAAQGTDNSGSEMYKNRFIVSSDSGKTWSSAIPSSVTDANTVCTGLNTRCWSLFELGGKLYALGGIINVGTSLTRAVEIDGNNDPKVTVINRSTFMPGLATNKSYIMDRQSNYNGKLLFILYTGYPDSSNGSDVYFNQDSMYIANSITDGRKVTLPESTARPTDILVRDDGVYVLAFVENSSTIYTNIVYKSSGDLTVWEEQFRFNTSMFARSFEEINRDFYFGIGGHFNASTSLTGTIYKLSSDDWAPNAKIISFTAPSGAISNGTTITLNAVVSDVTTCSLNNGIGNVSVVGGSTITVDVPATFSYKLSCTNSYNDNVDKTVYLSITDAQSSVADLTSLSATAEGILSPAFSPEITSYTLRRNANLEALSHNTNSLASLSYTKADPNSSIVITGNTLSAGRNTVTVAVTAQNGSTTKSYTINVVKLPALSSLTVRRNGGDNTNYPVSPVFDPNNSTPQYEAIATTTSAPYIIEASSADPGTTVTIKNLEGGATTNWNGTVSAAGTWAYRLITVTTSDGISSEYRLRVRGKANVAELSALTAKSADNSITHTLNPVFAATTYGYSLSVDNSVNSLNITATPKTYSTYTVSGNTSLVAGENIITVRVTSEGGTVSRDYNITVTKAPDVVTPKENPTAGLLDFSLAGAKTYTASSQPIAVTAKGTTVGLGDITVKYTGTNGTSYPESATAPTNAGSYIVYADIDEGTSYNPAKLNLGTFTINKASITIAGATVTAKTYDGTVTANISAVMFDGMKNGEILAINTNYTVSNAKFNSADAGTNKTVTATVALVETSAAAKNYILSAGNLSVPGKTINKAAASSIPRTTEVKSNDIRSYDFNLNTLLPSTVSSSSISNYSLSTITGDIFSSSPSISGNVLTIPIKDILAGDYIATIKIQFTSNNYDISEATITINATDKTPVTISNITVTSRAYNGNNITWSGTPIFTDSSSQTKVFTPNYNWQTSDGTALGEAPKNAGSYKLIISADGGLDYKVTDMTIDFNITKATQTVNFSALIIKYVGDTQSLSALASSGPGGITYSSSDETIATVSGNVLTLLDEGSVIITAKHAGDSNYLPAESNRSLVVTTKPIDFTIIDNFPIFDGAGDRTAIIDADASQFVRLTLDSKEVNPSNYTVTSGSTILTLKEAYLSSLPNGSYTFTAHFTNGRAFLISTVSRFGGVGAPHTGTSTQHDNSNATASLIITPSILISIIYIIAKSKSKRIRLRR